MRSSYPSILPAAIAGAAYAVSVVGCGSIEEDLGEDEQLLELDVDPWRTAEECDSEGDGELGQNCSLEDESEPELEHVDDGPQGSGRDGKPAPGPDAEGGPNAERGTETDPASEAGRDSGAEPGTEPECKGCQDRCAEPDTGCSCLPGTAPVACQLPPGAMRAGSVLCEDGERYCRDGRWTRCIGVAAFE